LEQAGSHSYKIIYRAVFPTPANHKKNGRATTPESICRTTNLHRIQRKREPAKRQRQQSHRQADPKIVEKSDDRLFLRALDNDNVRDGTRDGQVSRERAPMLGRATPK